MISRREPGWIRRLGGFVLRHRRDVAISVGAAVLGSAFQAGVPLVARHIVDAVVVGRTDATGPWLGLLLLAAAAGFGFAYLRRYYGGRVALTVQYDLRTAMHDHLQTLDQGTLGLLPTGQLVSRANSDSALVQGLLSFLPLMSGNILMMIASLVVMLVLSPVLALVGLVGVPALVAVSYRMRWRVFPATWDGQQREGDVAQIVDEDVGGVRVVKAFGQEDRELRRIAAAAARLFGSRMRAVRLQARYQPLLEAIPQAQQVAILSIGGWMALRHELSIGTFLAFSTYVAQFAAPARQLAGLLTVGQQARAGVMRILAILDLPSAITDAPDAIDPGPVRGEIVFEHVEFAYPDGPTVLRGVDLRIAPGERVAIVGPSGCGKSTVASLLARFADPVAGRVTLDGRDLRRLRLAALRARLGICFEESFLFSDTVRANIAYGRPDADDREIEAAARAADAHDFVLDLPLGYDTVVGERGLSLSGGQRQRLALARAILVDPRVLVLDDATSAVDVTTEARIHDALDELLPGRTTVMVAHRLSTVRLADRVVLMDSGRVVDSGTHADLTARSAGYRAVLSGLDPSTASAGPDAAPRRVGAAAPRRVGAAAPRRVGAAADDDTDAAAHRGNDAPGRRGAGAVLREGGASPELLARVAALGPITDVPVIDLEAESRPDPRFGLSRLLYRFRGALLVGLALVIVDAVCGLAGPVLVRTGIDDGVGAGAGGVLAAAAVAFALITLIDLGAQVASTFVMGRTAERVMLSLRIRIFAQLQRLSLDYYEREMSGRILTRMTTDVDQFESLVENGLLAALVAAVTFVGVGIVLVVTNALLGALTLSVVVPLAVATVLFRRRAGRLYELSRERLAVVNADFSESLAGVREAQAFVHEARGAARFHALGRAYLASRVGAQRLVAVYFPFVQFLSAVADAIVLGVGASLIGRGRLTSGELIAFILYIDMFFSPIQQLSQVFDAWQQTRVSVGRIAELMRQTTLTPTADHPVPVGRLRGELALVDVHFSYPRTAPASARGPSRSPEALRGIDLRIGAGETVAVVGETGAGKSTVMKLLARFYDPDSGSVRIDGLDVRRLDPGDYRRHLGYVPQEPFLFTGSVRDNIAYGRPTAGDAEVEAAARAVGAHELVTALPGGYHHEVAERGRSLSAGQRQLIALARAELVDPAVLLLDEATSNLDLATEAAVGAALHHLSAARTTVLIAHRLQTARTADRIVVLDHGVLVESGTHDALMEAGGRYAAMWRAVEPQEVP